MFSEIVELRDTPFSLSEWLFPIYLFNILASRISEYNPDSAKFTKELQEAVYFYRFFEQATDGRMNSQNWW